MYDSDNVILKLNCVKPTRNLKEIYASASTILYIFLHFFILRNDSLNCSNLVSMDLYTPDSIIVFALN